MVSDEQVATARTNIGEALQQLRDIDHGLHRWSRHYMPRILIRPVHRTHYHIASNTCMLDIAAALVHPPVKLATTVVHEATHARLCLAGIPYTPTLKDRVEKICVAQELAFARKFPEDLYPGKERWIAQLVTYLEHGPTPRWHELWDKWDKERPEILKAAGKL